jgi:hypothetical protein
MRSLRWAGNPGHALIAICPARSFPRAGARADDRKPQTCSALSTDRRAASVAARIAGVFSGIAMSLDALVVPLR